MSARAWPSAAAAASAVPARAPELRRLCVQALARSDWPTAVLIRVAALLKLAEWPEGAEGARVGVMRALAGSGNLRLQLVGALAVPGWSLGAIEAVGLHLIGVSPMFEGEEMTGLRIALRGGR